MMRRYFPADSERPWNGLRCDTLDAAGVIVRRDWVAIPYRLPGGCVHRWRYFMADGRTWWGPGDGLVPYGLERLPHDDVRGLRRCAELKLLICEGESDTLAAVEHLADPYPDVFAVLGIPGATCWKPEWTRWLRMFGEVFLLGDGDEAGRHLNVRIQADLPRARPAALPEGEDVRSVLQERGASALVELLDHASYRGQLYESALAGDLEAFDRLRAEWRSR